ncbi:MAG: o-succinylbenzoate synthase [Actinomycetota bacterium]
MTASLRALLSSAQVVRLPLKTAFRSIQSRELLLFEGPNGWGEWAAFPEYPDEEAALWLKAAIEWAYEPLPTPKRTKVGVNAILPAVPTNEVSLLLAEAGQFSTVKIKVAEQGQNLETDIARILEVKNLYPEVKIRLDANGGFQISSAIELITRLRDQGIFLEYFEQPVRSIAELAELKLEISKHNLQTKIAADESVRKASDPLAVSIAGAADLLILKSAPLGGIAKAIEVARESKLEVVASSAMQSSISLAAELYFACSLPEIKYDCGLGTTSLFAGDLVSDSLISEGGQMELQRMEPEASLLQKYSVDEETRSRWLTRLENCGRILGLEP